MIYRCRARGSLNLSTLPPLLDPILMVEGEARSSSKIELDLCEVSFVTPGALAPLAALLEHAGSELPPVHLHLPSDADCRHYLASAGLLYGLQSFVTLSGANEKECGEPSTSAETLLPLTRLGAESDLPALLLHFERRLDEMLGRADDRWEATKRPIVSTARELCENVFQHAGGTPCWVVAQKYRPSTGNPFVEIAISDAGLGVRRTLAETHPEFRISPDGEALERMVEEHLSRERNPHRGNGYYVLQMATKELDGSFHLRSGAGEVVRRRKSRLARRDDLQHWPGTHLEIRLTGAGE